MNNWIIHNLWIIALRADYSRMRCAAACITTHTFSSHTQITKTNFFPEKALMKWSWKNFPEKLLTHDPKSENKLFSWVGTQEIRLEKFSRNAPHSWPEIRNFEKSLEKFSKKPSEWPPDFWKYFPGFGNMG